ncbi:sulfite exporter TauE/SafE family protein [Vibrio salinus]|uniref:sulfite exporter TauE/SafE family protein n=1 Tax=Vibrio salinus TaxID=2899784 RepID=UPI001E4D6053|nr:sulfite exporter TauE/SafE family protein [Vibrio salinus]MCE0495850.1 sulfite exporter TauE/SafE family protein [Vibrio salinus]
MVMDLSIITAVVIAGIIRGYTGFGYSMITILVVSLFYPVSEIVPAILLVELIISFPLVFDSWKKTHFDVLKPVLWATILGVPLGVFMLYRLPEAWLKVLVPLTITGLAVLTKLPNESAMKCIRSPWLCGFLSGWSTSAVSAGGAPIVIHIRHQSISAEQQRNTLVSYFFITMIFVVGSNIFVTEQIPLLPEHPYFYVVLSLAGALLGKQLFKSGKWLFINSAAYYIMIGLSVISLGYSLLQFIRT